MDLRTSVLMELSKYTSNKQSIFSEADGFIARHEAQGIKLLCPEDYPEITRDIPTLLFAKGDVSLIHARSAAIIGSREATDHGRRVARRLGNIMAESGICVMSGLAVGIDAAGHTGVLEAGGKTIAVLPSPLDCVLPKCNRGLAEKILEKGGLLLSEYPLGHDVLKRNYFERDRIQAALSAAVIVVESGLNSGTLHTAAFARKYGKPLYCYENRRIYGESDIQGNRLLISEGAFPLEDKNGISKLITYLIQGQSNVKRISEQ